MLFKKLKLIKNFLEISVPDRYKRQFQMNIDMSNITKAKFITSTFIALEIFQFIASFIFKSRSILRQTFVYYQIMYILMIIVMAVFLILFINMGKNVAENARRIKVGGIFFVSFILMWCAGISLLDQLSYGQIIVYTVAIISVAVVPVFKPKVMLLTYLIIHAIFLTLMPYFQKSGAVLFGNFINSIAFIAISWVIAFVRYKNRVEDFNNKIEIQEKSEELERVNRELIEANRKAEEANHKLEILSKTDSLTGILNRSVFDKMIKTEWDRCKHHSIPLSLIMIDIDYFKLFNDTYGHQAGDDCIKQIAGVLSNCARRSSDITTRYGGEEFAIILPHIEKENAIKLAEEMRRRVEELKISHESSLVSEYTTISLGVSTVIPSDKLSIEEFIRTADKALYEAKKRNRNIVVAD